MNETAPLFTPDAPPCRECSAGVMHLRHITYFTWLGEELITVPHFPAWICDMCGKREYDERAISWLTMLLSPNAGEPTLLNGISLIPRLIDRYPAQGNHHGIRPAHIPFSSR